MQNITKGSFNGECNRTVCNNIGATHYNHSTRMYYCQSCARLINDENRPDALRLYGHDLCLEAKSTTGVSFNPVEHENMK